MTGKIDNRRKKDPEIAKTADGKDRPSTQALLDRIKELQDFYDHSPVGYLTLDPKGRILVSNLSAATLLKTVRSELIGQSLYDFVVRDDRDTLFLHLRALFTSEKPGRCEIRIRDADEKMIHTALESMCVTNWKGRHVCMAVLIDLTDRIRLEQALKENEERLRIALEAGRLGIWDRDLITDKTVWDRHLYEMLGRDQEGPAITGETFFTYIHPEDIDRVRRHVAETYQKGIDFTNEFRVIREDGETRWLAASGKLYRDGEGRPVRMAGVNYDITDKKQAGDRLRRYQDELETRVRERTAELEERTRELQEEITRRKRYEADLKASGEKILEEFRRRRFLSKKMVELLERERREIGRSLHDEVGQLLTNLSMELDLLKTNPQESAAGLKDRIEMIQNRIKESTAYFRDISRRLRPDILEHLGLIPAIRSLMEPFKDNTDIQTHVFIRDIPGKMDPEKELAIYRIVQEATTNILRYACAKNIFINLLKKDEVIRISVEDDGKGFEYDELSEGKKGDSKLGIVIMKERAAQLGGTLRIESQPGKGTQIFAEIPVD